MLVEEIKALIPQGKSLRVLDCTLGEGGHAKAVLESADVESYVGIDCDAQTIDTAAEALKAYKGKTKFMRMNYSMIGSVFKAESFDMELFDLGVSTRQLLSPDRGFSIKNDGPLDMRMDTSSSRTAADIVNYASERDLADIIWRYGEERRSRMVARALVAARPILSTARLAQVVAGALKKGWCRTHPATKVFQALRIAVNEELENLKTALEAACILLKKGGRLCVISFHSLEDRIVKHFFASKRAGTDEFEVFTKKPIVASRGEIESNPRSRSAKLRVLLKKAGCV